MFLLLGPNTSLGYARESFVPCRVTFGRPALPGRLLRSALFPLGRAHARSIQVSKVRLRRLARQTRPSQTHVQIGVFKSQDHIGREHRLFPAKREGQRDICKRSSLRDVAEPAATGGKIAGCPSVLEDYFHIAGASPATATGADANGGIAAAASARRWRCSARNTPSERSAL